MSSLAVKLTKLSRSFLVDDLVNLVSEASWITLYWKGGAQQVDLSQIPSEAHNARVKVKQTAQLSKPFFLKFPDFLDFDII